VATSATAKTRATEAQRNLEAKQATLKRIRDSLAAAPDRATWGDRARDHVAPRPPRSTLPSMTRAEVETLAASFGEALEAVSGRCTLVGDEAAAAERVEEILAHCDARTIALSDAPLVKAVTRRLRPGGRELLQDANAAALFGCDVGITSAQWAVAETGTLVLESDAERHRLASLVPPVHIALVSAKRLRRTLAEVLEDLNDRAVQSSPVVTLITGPSRTSDIELTLAIGVHGPGELYVIVVGEGTPD
jgi:L-lactate dehydrogenase complex protein LldG